MTSIDLTSLVEDYETVETRAYKHALDISYQIAEAMRAQSINHNELAQRMGVSPCSAIHNAQYPTQYDP